MEIITGKPAWLDKSHPNFVRWQKGRQIAEKRGKFVEAVVSQFRNPANMTVLDIGSGEGGTSKVFSNNNFVLSVDISLLRLQRQDDHINTKKVNCSGLSLAFKNNSFDLIIIQDVIEHLTDINIFYSEITRVLKSNGNIFLSTPNKLSIFNLLADPHFGLPLVSILKRETIKKYFLKYFRKQDYCRTDIAQLLSLNDLTELFAKEYNLKIHTKFSVRELFKGNEGIIWSDFHRAVIRLCRLFRIDWFIVKAANDRFGLVNKLLSPTFYFSLTRISTKHD